MNEQAMKIKALAQLISVVTDGEWYADGPGAHAQAEMYLNGVRDGRIADATFQAAALARMIGQCQPRTYVSREPTIGAAMVRLGDTDGQGGSTWDPGVLLAAAESCMRGESPYDFEGRPSDDDHEHAKFVAVWNEIQGRTA